MKKLFTLLLVLALVFGMTACGGSETDGAGDAADDAAQDEVQEETVDTDVLTESDQIVIRVQNGDEMQPGTTIAAMEMSGANLEVLYGGELVTGYEFAVEGEPCVSAAMWEEDNFHLGAVKNGTCNLVIVYGEEKATYPVVVEGLPEVLALNWIGYIIMPAGVDSDGVFGTPGLDDDIAVLFNGEPVTDYTYTVSDESLAEVTQKRGWLPAHQSTERRRSSGLPDHRLRRTELGVWSLCISRKSARNITGITETGLTGVGPVFFVRGTIRDNIFKGQHRCYFYPLTEEAGQQKDNGKTQITLSSP